MVAVLLRNILNAYYEKVDGGSPFHAWFTLTRDCGKHFAIEAQLLNFESFYTSPPSLITVYLLVILTYQLDYLLTSM